MTIQRARFLPKLFTMNAFHTELGIARPLEYLSWTRVATVFARSTDKTRAALNNGKAGLRQRIDRSKDDLRHDSNVPTPVS